MRAEKRRIDAIGLSLLVGLIAGVVVSLFRFVIVKNLAIITTAFKLARLNWWWLLVLCGWFVVVWAINLRLLADEPDIAGSGIPQIEGMLQGRLNLSWWQLLWKKWLGGSLAIGSGLALGREGPSIMLGALVGSGISAGFKRRGVNMRILVASGAAAGLSAAFNAPLAAALFVLEEIYHNFAGNLLVSCLVSAVSANFISANLFGLKPVLALPQSTVFPLDKYWILIVMGVLLGVLGLLYQYLTLNAGSWLAICHIKKPLAIALPFGATLFVGKFFPSLLGGGHALIETLGETLAANHWQWQALVAIFVVRLAFSTLCYASGLPGGIFFPILSLGAILGAILASLAAAFHLLNAALMVDCVIYAMAGYFACICKAPFTAIILITEMVGSLQHLMPLATVALVAYIVVDLAGGRPIYAALLDKRLAVLPLIEHQCDFMDEIVLAVSVTSPYADKQLREIPLPDNCLLVKIERGQRFVVPKGNSQILSGDLLVFEVPANCRGKMLAQLDEKVNGMKQS